MGNAWHLVSPKDPQDKMDYLVYKTLKHDGDTYFQFKPLGTDADVEMTFGIREDDGVFYELHGEIANSGLKVSAGTIKSMDMNLDVGEVWKDELTLNVSGAATGTLKHSNEGKIFAKEATVAVNGKTYKDVVKSEVKKTIKNSMVGSTSTIVYEFWLAKGVGLIYEKTSFSDSHSISYGLVNYALK